ncbi:MAG: TIGR02996 domain-containing protein [Kofleriaceae bacterium]
MSTEAVLLAAIAENPDDEAAWLVYADWLQQRGDPRGELVQLESALAEMDDLDERRRSTTMRIRELREAHTAAWLAPYRALEDRGVWIQLDRGIPSRVRGTSRALAAAAADIIALAPFVTGMSVEVGELRELDPLAGSPLLDRLHALELAHYTPVRPTGWAALGALPELRALALSSIAAGPADLEAVLAAPHAPRLRSIVVSTCRLNRGALEPFARMRCAIRHLDLPGHHQGARLGELVGGTPAFHGLVKLRIPGNELGRAGLAAMRPALRQVEYLDVRGNDLEVDDVAGLLDDAVLPRVRELWIGGNALDDALVERLVSWPGAARLVRLNLGNAGITARGARLLAEAAPLANLRSLVLSGPRFDAGTEAALVGSPHLARARIYAGDRTLSRKPAAGPAKRRTKRG